jgi:Domain of Unknown Function (DUF1080)
MRILRFVSLLFVISFAASAVEQPSPPKPSVGDPFEDPFENATLGDHWQIGGGVYKVDDGVLIAGEKEGNHHPGIFKIWKDFDDIVLKFSFRFDGTKGFSIVFNDPAEKSVHSGHVVRLSIAPKSVTLTDDKTGLMSLQWVDKRTDPKFKNEIEAVRDKTSRRFNYDFKPGQWYDVTMEVVGDEMRVSVDGKFVGKFNSPGFAHPTKKSFHFSISARHLSLDNIRAAIPGK